MNARVLVALSLASFLAAPTAAAQCGAGLRNTDRAELVARTVHGLAYLEHPTLGFRLLAPALARASDGAQEPRAHLWRWEAAGEHVEVRITCDDRASEPEFLRVVVTEHAAAETPPSTPLAERYDEGHATIDRREASGAYVVT